MKRISTTAIPVALALLLGVVRLLLPERPMDYTGPRALLDSGFSIGLLALTLLLAGGIGLKVQRRLQLEGLTSLERAIFALPVGLGVLAYGVLALGLVGALRPGAVLLWLLLVGLLTWQEWSRIVGRLPGWLAKQPQIWRGCGWGKRLWLIVGGLILALTLLQALSPPTDTDGLVYHLQAPRLFLEAGRLFPMPDNRQANYPLTTEMLFTIGLAFGSDTFAGLMHLTYALLLVSGAFALGRRFLRSEGGWVAAAILIGIPAFPIWASSPIVDMAWALYEFLGLYALIFWAQTNRRRWLVLAGLMTGLALGHKYLALGGGAALGLWLLWHSRRQGWRAAFAQAALFGGIALLVGSPWYIKNWLWLGNPIYPLLFGGEGFSQQRTDLLVVGLQSYGFWDYLLLPWNLYVQHEQFGGTIEIPSLLFPLALLYPLMRRRGAMDWIAGIVLLRFVAWALMSHVRSRYLLPVFPGLSVLTSSVLVSSSTLPALRRWGRIVAVGLIGGMVAGTLTYSILFYLAVQPTGVVMGLESKDAFLRRELTDYSALQYVNTELPPEARVYMMWDGRGYYCDMRCLPDSSQDRWLHLTWPTASVSSVVADLRGMGVTHLLLSAEDADYALQDDPDQLQRHAAVFFLQEFRPACTKEIYRDEWATLFELTCE